MNQVVIVTDTKGILASGIAKNLTDVFGSRIEISHIYLNELNDHDSIDGDVILVMLEKRLEKLMDRIKRIENTVVISRTLKEFSAMKLQQIPLNSKALVMCDCYENTLKLTSILYKSKLRKLQYISYEDDKSFSDIKYLISPGPPVCIPDHIEQVIDVGFRCVDTSTFIFIMKKLNLNGSDVQKKLQTYLSGLVTLETDIKGQFEALYRNNQRLNNILLKSNDGILLFNQSGKIILSNTECDELFGKKLINHNIKDLLKKDILLSLDKDEDTSKIINLNNKQLMISLKTNYISESKYEKTLVLKDITYIRKLEHTLIKKVASKGFMAKYKYTDIIYKSKIMKDCIEMSKRYAGTDKTILIQGESGSGKELFAQSIHNSSARRKQPFVAVNCAALPESLLESELFGYDKGAFTGAKNEGKIGLFEQANHGTLFLDEIADMPITFQTRLLRVIQEMQVMRIGSESVLDLDVRIIAASNKNLIEEVKNNRFRNDLYYRLNILPLTIPSLKERKEDIILLFNHFLENCDSLASNISDALLDHDWPGNIRELRNVSDYYNIMKDTSKPLPENLFQVSRQKNIALSKQILYMIDINSNHACGIGRNKLLDLYNSENDSDLLTEYKLRIILDDLREKGYLNKNIGRAGCLITDDGKKYLISS